LPANDLHELRGFRRNAVLFDTRSRYLFELCSQSNILLLGCLGSGSARLDVFSH
jgi:hypothetical protein